VKHIRDAPHPGGSDRRGHHVTPHAEDDIRFEAVDDAKPRAQGGGHDGREREVLPDGVAVQPADSDGRQLEARLGHELLFGTAGAPDHEHSTVRLLSAKSSGDGERRVEVPAGPAASYQKPHPSSLSLS
jgi:hypothetical protein